MSDWSQWNYACVMSNRTGEDFQQVATSILHIFTFYWLFLSHIYSYVSLLHMLSWMYFRQHCSLLQKATHSNQFLIINSAISRNAFFTVITTIKSCIHLLQQLTCFQYIIIFSSYTSIISWRENWRWEFPCHETFLKLLQAYPLIA